LTGVKKKEGHEEKLENHFPGKRGGSLPWAGQLASKLVQKREPSRQWPDRGVELRHLRGKKKRDVENMGRRTAPYVVFEL